MKHANQQNLRKLYLRVGLTEEKALADWASLLTRYSEPHRSYHNLQHLESMLGWLEKSGEGSDSIALAIWFHDVIYDPHQRDNEEQSARLFESLLGEHLKARMVGDVTRLIRATDPSRARAGKADEDLLIDIDLGILGASSAAYQHYCREVREEYHFVPEPDFLAGRLAILTRFVAQPTVYATEFFQPLEGLARENLGKEIEALEAALADRKG